MPEREVGDMPVCEGVNQRRFPSREGLIVGAVLVALYRRQQEAVSTARHFGDDPEKHPVVVECNRLIAALKLQQRVSTSFDVILDVLAHTRQTMRVSIDEWESCVPIETVCKD